MFPMPRDHLLLYCAKKGCERCSSLFLGYLGSLPSWVGVGLSLQRSGEKCGIAGPLCIFWVVWKARNDLIFRDEVLPLQKVKSFFVYLLWPETKMFSVDGPMALVHFFDWVGSR